MADEQGGLKAFFQTVPGILTAIATLIAAVSGLLLALNQAGFFEKPPGPSPSADTAAIQTPAAEESTTASSVTETEQALLSSFRGCWHADNTGETVESTEATGTFDLPSGVVNGTLDFCFKDRDDGTVYFEPPAGGDTAVSEAMRQIGISSERLQWTAFEFDPSNRQMTLKYSKIIKYNKGD